jgi:hypothetical protein
MRVTTPLVLILSLAIPVTSAQIIPEEVTIETMPDPGELVYFKNQ